MLELDNNERNRFNSASPSVNTVFHTSSPEDGVVDEVVVAFNTKLLQHNSIVNGNDSESTPGCSRDTPTFNRYDRILRPLPGHNREMDKGVPPMVVGVNSLVMEEESGSFSLVV